MTWLRKSAVTMTAVALSVSLVAACSSGKDTPAAGGNDTGKIKIYYMQKQGTQDYFIGEAAGARKKAQELGIDLVMVDLGNDTSKALDAINTAAAQKAKGIIIVVPDPSVGPAVVQAAKDKGIALLTTDDQI